MAFRASAVFALGCTLLFGVAGITFAETQKHARPPGFQDDPAVVPDVGPEYGEGSASEMAPSEDPRHEEGYYSSEWYPQENCDCNEGYPYYQNYSPSLMSRLFNSDSKLRQVMGRPGQIVVGADYLHVRANFSEALAYVERDTSNILAPVDTFHQLSFDYDDSYRFYGGYRWNNCDEEIRFSFAKYQSSAGLIVQEPDSPDITIEIPLKTTPFPGGGDEVITGSAEVNTYDLGYAKTIPLGGPMCCECGDPCGCGDPCNSCPCPAWDITWYGGVRYAEVDTGRTFSSITDTSILVDEGRTLMSFDGIGLRTGLEGRRYMGRTGAISIFMRGDISLLVGEVDTVIESESTETPGQIARQLATFRNVIPVTDIEGGVSAHLTKNTTLSAGYLFSAWHDLGFREQFPVGSNFGVSYDDANILAFDGLFVRLEAGF